MNNYDEKMLNIKDTQKQLLEFAKNKINDKSDVFNKNVESVIDVLNYDSKMVKKYEAVVEAQKLIIELTNQIKNSTSVEEIIEIRKKLNYYINKIKKEIKNRNIDSTEYDKYVLNATNLRKGISEYIRYLKREDKIKEIEYLKSKDNLSEEEAIRLKKLLKNEVSYGKRNLNKYNTPEEEKETAKVVKPQEKEKLDYFSPQRKYRYIKDGSENEENVENNQRVLGKYFKNSGAVYSYKKVEKPLKTKGSRKVVEKRMSDEAKKIVEAIQQSNPTPNKTLISTKSYDSLYEFLDDTTTSFASRYHVLKKEKYTRNIIKNIKIFVDNMEIIRCNKMSIKRMMGDYSYYYPHPELYGYIEYMKRDTSVIKSMKNAIIGSRLKDTEKYYYEEHQKCVAWIMEFFKEKNIECKYNRHA